MIEPFLKSQLEPVARRQRSLQLWGGLALCWFVTALAAFGFLALQRWIGFGVPFGSLILGLAGAVAATVVWRRSRKWQPDFRQIARQIEQHHPELHALLLTAVEQQPDPQTGRLTYLQERVIREALAEGQKHNWIETVSDAQLFWRKAAHLAALAALVTALANMRSPSSISAERALLAAKGVIVTPGDVSLERGSGLVVLARFAKPLPSEAALVMNGATSGNRRVPLVKNLDDPVFGGSIPEVTEDLRYHIEYGSERTREFKISVFEYPSLQRADAQIKFPEYTGLPEKKIDDTRRVSAVEGSLLDLSLQLNKPVVSANFVAKDQTVVPLLIQTNQPSLALRQFPFEASKTYELKLVDAEGRTNKVPAQFIVDVLKNRTPELKLVSPRGDQRVSPLQEIAFQAEAWDDFGLRAYGLTYTIAGEQSKTIVLGESPAGNPPITGRQSFTNLLSLEQLSVQPDQVISYFVWADDIGPDGKVRRTSSDMFFAEVRPFEEIFREEQSPQGEESQQQSGGNESMKLAELQKQIINATWKLQRQEKVVPDAAPSAQYKKDAPVVEQSQEQAREQAGALKQRAPDARAKALVEKVEQEMDKAVDHLKEAVKSPASLPAALAAEQSAYQALLKLAAHEYRVSQSRGRGSAAAGSQRNQQQLDQLELKQSENRYETQRQASAPQNPEQREQLQVLNRLKELAQRQQDLNEKLKELQTALQEAKTEKERDELRRELKRLRDEEREVLADIDELQQRMQQPQNQSRMAEASKQLEQSRSEAQRAAESLEKEAVPQALTSGTRAQRDLQNLRDDFRRKNSSQFTEEMRQMRSEARELAQKEEEIAKQMESLDDTKHKTLTDSGPTKALADQLQQQKGSVTNLLENMRSVTERAESSEPLLSKQLYDTLRKNSQGNLDNSLTMTAELLNRNFVKEAGKFEQRARQEVDELKQGVERAAESVLGNDTESLRLAKHELDDLTQQLEKEIAQANRQVDQAAEGRTSPENRQKGDQSSNPGAKQPGNSAPGKGSEQQTAAGRPDQQASAKGAGGGKAPDNAQVQQGDLASKDPSSNGQGSNGQSSQAQRNNAQGNPSSSNASRASQREQKGGSTPGDASQNELAQGANPQPGNGQNPRGAKNSATARRDSGRNFFDPGDNSATTEGEGTGPHGPITGPDYAEWSDRLRDVEEMIDPTDLRNEVARIRDRARVMRTEFKRHSKTPQWSLVRSQIAAPLAEVRSRIAEELARRESNDALVPIDRDPVPAKFSDLVRRYYEKLGSNE